MKRTLRRLTPAIVVLAAFVAVGAGVSAASTVSPTVLTNLWSVSCPSAKNCVAVGGSYEPVPGTAATQDQAIVVYASTNGHWAARKAPSGAVLHAVSCPTVSHCWAIGQETEPFEGAAVYASRNGRPWKAQKIPQGLLTLSMSGLSCPSTEDCVATAYTANANPVILATTNGGASWEVRYDSTPPPPGTSSFGYLFDLSCPSIEDCSAVGQYFNTSTSPWTEHDAVLGTTNGGLNWTAQIWPNTSSQNEATLNAVSCPSTKDCVVVGLVPKSPHDAIFVTTDGGATWRAGEIPLGSVEIDGVACPSTKDCVAVGLAPKAPHDAIFVTTNGGLNWKRSVSVPGNASQVTSVSCPTRKDCVAVADTPSLVGGAILTTTNGGTSWKFQMAP